MGLTLDISVSALTVFLQGILSFFSPCVLPILPVYISYFSGGAKTVLDDGQIVYNQKKVFLHTLFFVLGISVTFFVLGFSFTAFGQFFTKNQNTIASISGAIMIAFGVYNLGFFKRIMPIEREHRLNVKFDLKNLSLLSTLALGFTFSFAWTPCIGPIFASVLLMASSSADATRAFVLILAYTLGFIIPFLAVGTFTATILSFFKKHQNIIRYTIKIGAVLLIFMGIITISGGLQTYGQKVASQAETSVDVQDEAVDEVNDESVYETPEEVQDETEPEEVATVPIFDFTLTDQYGQTHTLSDYEGQVVFLNFWATWCSPCKQEMPYIEQIYQEYGLNEDEVVILSVASPNYGQEGSVEYISEFLIENGYNYPVLMDENAYVMTNYAISAFPTTFMIDTNSNIYGYVTGSLPYETMISIIEQTLEIN